MGAHRDAILEAIDVAAANDGLFQAMCRALGLEELGQDERFAANPGRGENRAELIPLLAEDSPGLPVLVLSMHDEALYAKRALQAGARGYIMKHEGSDLLLKAIRTVLAGQIHVSSAMNATLLRSFTGAPGSGTSLMARVRSERAGVGAAAAPTPTPAEPARPPGSAGPAGSTASCSIVSMAIPSASENRGTNGNVRRAGRPS